MTSLADLDSLEAPDAFVARHIGPSEPDILAMLHAVSAPSLDALMARTIPAGIRATQPIDLPPAADEAAVLSELAALAAQNDSRTKSLIGCGYHNTHTPPVILRNVLENPGWYTAYTPYQAEIAQGRLEALLNFQTMVTDLTGLPIANASLLDEATAAAEAVTMAHGLSRTGSRVVAVATDLHPQTRAVLETRARPLDWTLVDFAARRRGRHRCRQPVCRRAAIPRHHRRPAPAADGDRRRPRSRRVGHRVRRPAQPGPADPARRDGCRRRRRQCPALRRADGLRRPARGVLRHHGSHQAADARPPGRPQHRCRRPPRPAPGAADARAAHPPREGHQQHLHRPGAAGGDRRLLRRVARPRRPAAHRPPREPAGPPAGRRRQPRRPHAAPHGFLRYRHAGDRRQHRRPGRQRARRRLQHSPSGQHRRVHRA